MSLLPYRAERIGNLRERVTLLRRAVGQDGWGQPTETYVPFDEVSARVEPLKGSEAIAAAQVQSTQSYRIYLRYRDDLTVLDRIAWGAITLNVTAISNADERRRFLTIDCSLVNT
jgi:SPP1 family predicted phage head-tail adaptor